MMSKDKTDSGKEYLVDKKVDTALTPEEQKKLRQKKVPVGTRLAHNRQDVFADRRDPYSKKSPSQPERRKNKRDRRELDD